jgi:four helix bundle protein
MALQSYRDLKVWQKSIELVMSVYQLVKQLPDEEKYGLISQMRRAAVSIPANIAEGYGRTRRGEYLRHLSIAKGSLYELETHLVIAVRLNFVEREETKNIWDIAQDVGKMLNKLIQSLTKDEN